MAAFKRVVLTEREDAKDLTTSQDSVVEREANSFDNYTDKKLNDLYREFDSITVNETDLSSGNIENIKASRSLSAINIVRLSATLIIAALLIFLAIYNIFVINNLKSNINIINSDIANEETVLQGNMDRYAELTDTTNIEQELIDNGYVDISGVDKQTISVPSYSGTETSAISTNWWDSFCNFIASVFGR